MNAPKFTPGPWRLHKVAHLTVVGDQPGYGEMSVASCAAASSNVHELDEAQRANANLISAAPDLYEALRKLVNLHIVRGGPYDFPLGEDDQDPEMNAAVAALAKAEGRRS